MGHLEELRKVILISLLSLIPTTAIGWFFKDWVLEMLTRPLREINPEFKLLALGLVSPFFVFFKLAIGIGIILALPVILYQVWSFVLPALKRNERRVLAIIVPSSVLLFIAGVLFGYFTVFQIAVKFLWQFAVDTGSVIPSYALQDYLSFAVGFLLGFGAVFELPIVILTLAKLGIVTPRFLAAKRKYALLIIVVIAAFLTPGPDVISQLLMAAPMYILYEASIWLSYLVRPKLVEDQSSEEEQWEERVEVDYPPQSLEELEARDKASQQNNENESATQEANAGFGDAFAGDSTERLAKILNDIEEAGRKRE